jgi:undecaprenyl-diphosphatase
LYAAVAQTETPGLDRVMRRLSRAADRSRLNLAAAVVLTAAGGPRGRRAARVGVASVAVSSAVVNAVAKPVARRGRPDREANAVPLARHVKMPTSRSLPSGHAASAFAFATGVGTAAPHGAAGLRVLAALVAYSRVHTGVHYPGDVVAGALLGTAIAQATAHAIGGS